VEVGGVAIKLLAVRKHDGTSAGAFYWLEVAVPVMFHFLGVGVHQRMPILQLIRRSK
jgi:hypothetical protein